MRFVIERDGTVGLIQDDGSDLPDGKAKRCVIDAYRRIRFPPPDGGTVTVVYPIMFSPEDSGADVDMDAGVRHD